MNTLDMMCCTYIAFQFSWDTPLCQITSPSPPYRCTFVCACVSLGPWFLNFINTACVWYFSLPLYFRASILCIQIQIVFAVFAFIVCSFYVCFHSGKLDKRLSWKVWQQLNLRQLLYIFYCLSWKAMATIRISLLHWILMFYFLFLLSGIDTECRRCWCHRG